MSQNEYGNDNFAIILLYIYLVHNNIQPHKCSYSKLSTDVS